MSKVNLESMKGWIAKEINSILGFEDDVLIDMIYNLLSLDEKVDPKHIEVTLIPFLERSAIGFTEKLWSLLLSAQKDPLGIPQEFVEQRMEELKKQKEKEAETKAKIESSITETKETASPKKDAEVAKIASEIARLKPILKRRSRSRSRDRPYRRSRSRSWRRDHRSSRYDRRRSYSRSKDRSRRHGRRSHSRSRSRSRSNSYDSYDASDSYSSYDSYDSYGSYSESPERKPEKDASKKPKE